MVLQLQRTSHTHIPTYQRTDRCAKSVTNRRTDKQNSAAAVHSKPVQHKLLLQDAVSTTSSFKNSSDDDDVWSRPTVSSPTVGVRDTDHWGARSGQYSKAVGHRFRQKWNKTVTTQISKFQMWPLYSPCGCAVWQCTTVQSEWMLETFKTARKEAQPQSGLTSGHIWLDLWSYLAWPLVNITTD